MNGLYSRTNKLLFWKVKETKWIIATATVIIVMASMVFSVSNNITTSYQKAMADMAIPFDMIVTCESDEEVEQALGLATQYDKNILTTISTGDFLLGIPQSNFNLNIMAASDSLVEMYKLSVIEGDFPQNANEIMLDSKVSQISGGQQQRVAIARALANNPRIILADEPTGNLDSDISQKVMELLSLICKKYHKTIIMITHNEELAKMADRVIRLKNGKIV